MKLSIVTTLYCSEAYVEEFHRRSSEAARQFAGESYEIIMVNDGSPDKALMLAAEIAERDSHTIVVDLSRNFGHHRAMMTGLAQSHGELVFLIDSDLEEAPEWLSEFEQVLRREQCDAVYGVQGHRKGKFFERVSGECFYAFFHWITGTQFPRNAVTARLMSRRYVDSLILHTEREIFIDGLFHTTGYRQIAVKVNKLSKSPTTYSFRKKMALALDAITSFSAAPLLLIFYSGIIISTTSIFYILYLAIKKIYIRDILDGWTSLVVSIWFMSGVVILFLGIIGIYLNKIFYEIKQRPYTIIRQVYRKGE